MISRTLTPRLCAAMMSLTKSWLLKFQVTSFIDSPLGVLAMALRM